MLSDKDGKIHDPSHRECDRRRNSVERALWLRMELRASNPDKFKNEEEVHIEDWNWAVPIEQQDYTEEELTKLASGCGSCKTCGSTEGCSS
ncbi:MAG: hypothetical protein EAZ42_04660 [Verrucomicrobia bacterium]|nr:MAG: hypothetical protein EAZ42_04660 [Verrucomicrobiota bacterium]